MSEIRVKGLSELQKFLDQLPAKLEANVMRSALRAGAKVIQAEAKANVPVQSGELRKSIKVGTRLRKGKATASIRTKLFYARFVEFGTRAHAISGDGGPLAFAGIYVRTVNHPGAKPHPFMRPALDSQAQNAVVATAEHIKKRLKTKHSLDTADIEITTEDES